MPKISRRRELPWVLAAFFVVATLAIVVGRIAWRNRFAAGSMARADENMRLQPIEPIREADALVFLAGQAGLTSDADNGRLMFAIELRDEGRMIGEVGMYIESASKRSGDIGWSVNPHFRSRGYATKLPGICSTFASRNRKYERANTSSVRGMERLGMRREGTMRESSLIRGVWHDDYLYAMLGNEWHA